MIFLKSIRTPNNSLKAKEKIRNTFLIAAFGVFLGFISKLLDCMGIDDSIWWQHILGILDLNNFFSEIYVWLFLGVIISYHSKTPLRAALNVFVFFIGMTTTYHYYSIHYCGFNPKEYMKIWYLISCLSPISALVCWYAGGKNPIALIIKTIITIILFISSFIPLINMFNSRHFLNFLLFLIIIFIFYKDYLFRRKLNE